MKEAPFSAALKITFELGIERDLKWTLCNDAYVLLRPGAMKNMIVLAEQQDEKVCEIEEFIHPTRIFRKPPVEPSAAHR